jgi:epoxyqueuosine reductase
MSANDIKSEIEAAALAEGFAAIGFAAADRSETVDIYRDWLDQGYAGGMDYLQRHAPLKEHPEKVAPGVKTVIAVAARYPLNANPEGCFSSSARGLDYHDVIRGKLRRLAFFINNLSELKVHRVCVDSAPLPEREWAVRAGIGWQGKQGQIVSPVAGCCILLGFLLVDVEIEPSTPLENQCGDCRLCLKACPTGAVLGSGVVDARRCLSYLTIEPSAEIPADSQKNLHGALFGCDCCTAVCPWNKSATAPVMAEFEEKVPLPTATEIIEWSEEDFKARFKGTAVYRTGLEHLQRNAAVAAVQLSRA